MHVTLLPIKPHDGSQEMLIESLTFNSGRPVLIFDEHKQSVAGFVRPRRDCVGHSAQASRAVADALPLLKVAKRVRIFTMIEDEG